ncbi:sodium:proton exchanger, partial [Streptomyces virginiae]
FNALASVMVQGNVEGPVYRVGPPHTSHGVGAPHTRGALPFGSRLGRPLQAAPPPPGARVRVDPARRAGPA